MITYLLLKQLDVSWKGWEPFYYDVAGNMIHVVSLGQLHTSSVAFVKRYPRAPSPSNIPIFNFILRASWVILSGHAFKASDYFLLKFGYMLSWPLSLTSLHLLKIWTVSEKFWSAVASDFFIDWIQRNPFSDNLIGSKYYRPLASKKKVF